MPRSVPKVASRARRKKMLKLSKGFWGRRKNVWTIAKHHIEKGLLHAYVGRKLKKREYRRLWITRINAAARLNGTTYSKLMYMLKVNNININRKILADFAMNKPEVFAAIVKQATKQ
ncbi:MAG: 50S ribosomal protein L20 [Ignavibacteria bacterium]|jgi:large subunit ribosomal protein L20|nr:50S ribosomal protein L20 [Ignavibacteria bacterium]